MCSVPNYFYDSALTQPSGNILKSHNDLIQNRWPFGWRLLNQSVEPVGTRWSSSGLVCVTSKIRCVHEPYLYSRDKLSHKMCTQIQWKARRQCEYWMNAKQRHSQICYQTHAIHHRLKPSARLAWFYSGTTNTLHQFMCVRLTPDIYINWIKER